VIGDDGGPLIHNGSEEELSSFDSTRRKLHRFLTLHSARQPAAREKGAQTRVGDRDPGHNPTRVTHRFPGPSKNLKRGYALCGT
jgi:hypothetical protein